ncbi:MAG TPA: hypothetical protein VNA25_08820 [Phycisphaerae bacterium]|nr:hypothetical protein [Phycisphaerae bacterium]HUT57938.1 hypothetical protein [Phycisphaerae bacterium]
MRSRMFLWCVAAVWAFCAVAPADAQNVPPKADAVKTVTVTGAGMNKQEALRDAQRKAVEQAAGTFIYSQSQTKDFALVKDTVLTRAAGFVQSYETLSGKEMEDGTYEIKIKAVVSVKGIVDTWGVVKNLLQQMGRPKIMVYVTEKIGAAGVPDSTVQARIENMLLKSGFLLVDKERVKALAEKDKAFANLEDNPERLIAIMKQEKAQIFIRGSANATAGAVKQSGGLTLHTYEAEANIRTFRADTGQLMSTIPGKPTRGVQRVWRSAAKQALDFQAQQIAPLVVRDVLGFWQEVLAGRGELELRVEGISFKGYLKLKKSLAAVKQIKDVTVQFNNKVATCSIQSDVKAETLAEAIVGAVEDIEITDVSANTIKAKYKGTD